VLFNDNKEKITFRPNDNLLSLLLNNPLMHINITKVSFKKSKNKLNELLFYYV
jgi:hypothetical protein